jgi:hypothetical protein
VLGQHSEDKDKGATGGGWRVHKPKARAVPNLSNFGTKRARILKYLQDGGTLTQQESHKLFNDTRLAAHIEVLRKNGHRIFTETVNQGGSTFARYHYRKAIHE